MKLLPREELVVTGPVDHADWNYRAVLGFVQRRRFALALAALPNGRIPRLLEIGYGSGIFMPELARRADRLDGIDPHPHAAAVGAALARAGVAATLASGTAEALPYPDATFDVVLAVSSFEFIPDPVRAAREIARVLTPGGTAIVVTPGTSPLLDLALRIVTGESAQADYDDRRARVVPALEAALSRAGKRAFPPVAGALIPVYTAYRFGRRDETEARAKA